ncbi:hypothetical protein [Asanoa sp. NPDC050611]|uniref:hypothetical protein n=1 Tax=Asanoa sp. NPDC050611 TaxID=3157098 RepID=UPI0033DEAF98
MNDRSPRERGIAHDMGCGICGHGPTAETTFRGHEGLAILMRMHKVSSRLCRDCGISSFRDLTAMTLFRGWWSPFSLFVSPVVLAMNLWRRHIVAELPGPERTSARIAPNMRPLPLGRPVLARPQAWLGLVVLIGLIAFGVVYDTGPARECFRGDALVACAEPHEARVIAVVGSPYDCPAEAEAFVEHAGLVHCLVTEQTH